MEGESSGVGGAPPLLGKGSFGDVLLGWAVLPQLEGEGAVQWQARCRQGPQLAVKRIRPSPAAAPPRGAGGSLGLVRVASSKYLKLASRRVLGGGEPAAAPGAEQKPAPAPTPAPAPAPAPLKRGGMFNSSKTRLRDRSAVRQEAEILRLLAADGGCEHVVRLVDHVEDDRLVYLVMALVGGGDLTLWLKQQRALREDVVAGIFAQLLLAVQHCHSRNVVHRDLKPDNILVYDAGAAAPRVCLCDFGLAALLEAPGQELADVVGSAYFLAPEVLQQRYTAACDVWSLGVNLFLMLCGSVPFGAHATRTRDVHAAILQQPLATGSPEWAALSPLAKDLVLGLLEKDPSRRYTLREALAHQWLSGSRAQADPPPVSTAVIRSMVSFVSTNKLRARALGVVAECLTAREAAQLRAQFFQLDTNSDMALSQEELGAALEKMGLRMASAQLKRFMAAIDTDASGTISVAEFLAATAELALQQHKDAAVRAFSKFDVDGNGLISLHEARLALDIAQGEDAQLAEAFAAYATDGSQSLTFDAFWSMLKGAA